MAHFIGFVKGSRGGASRLGSKASGLTVRANGWETGARVELMHKDGVDFVTVWLTGGSNARIREKCLGTFRVVNNEFPQVSFADGIREAIECAKAEYRDDGSAQRVVERLKGILKGEK